jgi:ATP-binding cassette, subfamily B, bacterial
MGFHSGGWRNFVNSDGKVNKVTWPLLKRVLAYSRPYRLEIVLMLILILIMAGLSLITPLIMRDLIDRTIPNRDINRLIWLAVALLFIPVMTGGIQIWQRRLNATVGEGVIYDLRIALYSRLQRMSLRFFTNTKVGELMSRLNNDVVGAQNAISNNIVSIITNSIQAIAVMVVMFTLEWRLTLAAICILPLFFLAARQLGERLRQIAREHMELNARMNATMNETLNISGALLVKLFGRMDVENERFKDRAKPVRDIGVRRAITGVTFFVIIGLLSAIGTALVYGLGGFLVIQGEFTIGTIVAFGAYLSNLYSSLNGLASAPVEFASSIVSFERVFEIVDLPVDIEERPDPLELSTVTGSLVFDDVSFNYDSKESGLLSKVHRYGQMDNVTAALSGDGGNGSNGDRDDVSTVKSQARDSALQHISFVVKPGDLVAMVGPSGAGKTTLTYLIPRLYDPTSGRILIDGHDLRSVTLDSLTNQIGMVTQETHLFHDTIRTNLRYARLDATQSEIEEAARVANIHDFVSQLPDGYDTVVGERGYRLSGGEKQRLALARVILKNPQILVLDEATSHLDSDSEALIQEALKRVMAGRTSIVIAHRLSTILSADLILVMDRGEIAEQGTHQQLLARRGLYSHLYETQFNTRQSVNRITDEFLD